MTPAPPCDPGEGAADVLPAGGMARLRLWGRPTAAGREALGRLWFDALPDVQALEVLQSAGVAPAEAGRLVGARPLGADLPRSVDGLVLGWENRTVQDAGGRR